MAAPPERALHELARRQHGIVARWQLDRVGVGRGTVETGVRGGRLIRLHRGVYAVGHAALRREGWWLAAVLAVGPEAALSHRDAATLHGLRPSSHARVEVTTTGRARDRPRIRVHQVRQLDPRDVEIIDGIPVTTVARTLVDLAGIVPPGQLVRALGEADVRRSLDVRALEAAAERTRGRPGPGHARLRAALREHAELGAQLTRSALEDRFVALLAASGLPRPRLNAAVGGFEVDAWWPDRRLVVELDGFAFHATRRAFQRDREKATALTLAGCRVVRFTHRDVVHDPERVAAAVRRGLAAGGRRSAAAAASVDSTAR